MLKKFGIVYEKREKKVSSVRKKVQKLRKLVYESRLTLWIKYFMKILISLSESKKIKITYFICSDYSSIVWTGQFVAPARNIYKEYLQVSLSPLQGILTVELNTPCEYLQYPLQGIFTVELNCQYSGKQLSAYFRKMFHVRCLAGFWIRLCMPGNSFLNEIKLQEFSDT